MATHSQYSCLENRKQSDMTERLGTAQGPHFSHISLRSSSDWLPNFSLRSPPSTESGPEIIVK